MNRTAGIGRANGAQAYELEVLDEGSFVDLDIALFSAGEAVSRQFAPLAAKAGCATKRSPPLE